MPPGGHKFQKGQVANPEGARGARVWEAAVRRAALREVSTPQGKATFLNLAAEKLVQAAIEGDPAAIKELGDRLDGRSKTIIEGPGEDGAHEVRIGWASAK